MTQLRLVLVSLFALTFVAAVSVPARGQDMGCAFLKAAGRSSPLCPGSGGNPSSGGSSGGSSAQEKIAEINRNNAAAQQALKEGMDLIRGMLTSHSNSETNDVSDSTPDVSSPPGSLVDTYHQAAETYRKMAANAPGANQQCYFTYADFYDSAADELQ